MALKLLSESVDYDSLEYLIEANDETKEKTYKIKGPFLEAEIKNRNGRIYSKPVIDKEVDRYNKEKILTGRAMGECNHPANPEINLDRVSHLVSSLKMDGNIGIGEATILDTDLGRTIKALLKGGCQLGVSTRGIGSLKDDRVGDDYKLIAIDLVGDPSANSAWVQGILESKEYIIENNTYIEVAIDTMKKTLDRSGSKHIKEALIGFLKEIQKAR